MLVGGWIVGNTNMFVFGIGWISLEDLRQTKLNTEISSARWRHKMDYLKG